MEHVLEATRYLEIQKEAGITIHDEMENVQCTFSISDDGEPAVNTVFVASAVEHH